MKPESYSRYFSVSDADRAWGLHVTTVGRAVALPGRPYPPGRHPAPYLFQWERGCVLDEFMLLHIKKGGGIFDSRHAGNVVLDAGDVVVVCPREWHRYRPDPESGWEEFWVNFNGEMAKSWQERGFLSTERPLVARKMQFALDGLCEAILDHSKERNPAPHYLAGLCHGILGCVLSQLGMERTDNHETRLRMAAEYIHNHPGKVDLASLASHVGMSQRTFQRQFKGCFGATPGEYRAQERHSLAKRYLVETRLPLRAIAERLDYSSEFYFMKVFKEATGMTPSQWRSQHSQVS